MMGLKEIITGLVNSEDDTGCDVGLTVVEKKWVKKLHNYLKGMEDADKEVKEQETIKERREQIAQEVFEDDELDGLEFVDSDGWETDGDKFIKKFYYEDEENPDGDSKVATFVVVFKENSTRLIDSHVNIW